MNFFKKLLNLSTNEKEEIKKQEVNLSLDDLFVHNFLEKGGKFLYCIQKEEVVANLEKVLKENNWKEIHLLDHSLKSFFKSEDVHILEKHQTETPIVTSCEHLIADNGDILFSSRQLSSTKLTDYPDNFIVFAKTSQLVKDTGQGLTGIKVNSTGALPTNISAIKRYNIDISSDNFLNYGNSNSKNLYLLLLEDL
ncbi:LUD domain-containing protein [uncultured Polaribacter sp.]|uniref:LUD domain-containing protein n=1 Tax=uncultured Polaribacter sp. TaxID=174711 RepID=UPI00261B9AF7|nr:LUD domain-containing protein [uncultured Polaribacter sp.]